MRQRSALHFDREQMNKTLPKAMAFQPERNFEAFIRDYLLEAAMPDVRAVRASVDAHRRAKERLGRCTTSISASRAFADCIALPCNTGAKPRYGRI